MAWLTAELDSEMTHPGTHPEESTGNVPRGADMTTVSNGEKLEGSMAKDC